jgi:hypothetical protein
MTNFKFALGVTVKNTLTLKEGKVTARSEYLETHPNLYQLRYIDGMGDAVYGWFNEGDLED